MDTLEARRDIDHAALEIFQPVHEQHDDIDQRVAQIASDLNVIFGREVTLHRSRDVQQAHLVPALDPELLGEWRTRVASHDERIMQPPRAGSNRKAKTSYKFR